MELSGTQPSRRRLLKSAAALAAASSLPAWFVEQSRAHAQTPAPASPNERPGVALVGCGGQGRADAKNAARFGNVVALCDVDDKHAADAAEEHPGAQRYKDFRKVLERKDVDLVINATPDHWHTLINLHAMRAGKDVYSEKPLTLTIDEGRRLVAAVGETKRVLQTGSQQRSEGRFRLACELVRNGRIGTLRHVVTTLPAGPHGGPFQPSPAPAELDWDVWQGQAPEREFVRQRCHTRFRYWLEYSGGTITDWGAHHNDIALWAMGLDRSGPVSIEGKRLVEPVPGGYTAPSEYAVNYAYANGVTHLCTSTPANQWDGSRTPGSKDSDPQHGVRFEGTDGWLFVTRGRIEASDPAILQKPLEDGATRLYVSNDHMGNFVECARTRKEPVCPAEVGHRSASVCHLGGIAIALGEKLTWDPAKEQFVGNEKANAMVARPQRKPYTYEMA